MRNMILGLFLSLWLTNPVTIANTDNEVVPNPAAVSFVDDFGDAELGFLDEEGLGELG